MDSFKSRVAKVQKSLKAPKNQYNSFGKYKYRSCEDILEAAKPLCCDNNILLTVSDEIVFMGNRFYIKSTAVLHDIESDNVIENSAYAREADDKKGMDDSQITGTASSYARKYALNGLFCIDDTKDADTDEYKQETNKKTPKKNDYICKICGNKVKGVKKSDGTTVSAESVYNGCGGMCLNCYNAQKEGGKS
ncbi:MAG: ERF family protein [Huintestinicola sp.]